MWPSGRAWDYQCGGTWFKSQVLLVTLVSNSCKVKDHGFDPILWKKNFLVFGGFEPATHEFCFVLESNILVPSRNQHWFTSINLRVSNILGPRSIQLVGRVGTLICYCNWMLWLADENNGVLWLAKADVGDCVPRRTLIIQLLQGIHHCRQKRLFWTISAYFFRPVEA